jgi:endonuclease/exonuclease/phosphatase family metal-dependent hydrolase
VNFFSTHFSLSASARRRNVQELFKYANKHSLPQVIVGDFNDNPEGEAIQFLIGNHKLNGTTGDFKDAWKELNPGVEDKVGWTCIQDLRSIGN